jgi:PIN domain nuclease of toxin-antitoxin system
VDDPSKLGAAATASLQNTANQLLISAGSIWEIAIKLGKGQLPLSLPFRRWLDIALADLGLSVLAITLDYAERQSNLPPHYIDPFDRLIASQALVEGIPVVSGDTIFDSYGVNRIWD